MMEGIHKKIKFILELYIIILCAILLFFSFKGIRANASDSLETEIIFTYPENRKILSGESVEYSVKIKNNQKDDVAVFLEVSVPVDNVTGKGNKVKSPTELVAIQHINEQWNCLYREKGSTGEYTTYVFAYSEFLDSNKEIDLVPFSLYLKETEEYEAIDLDQVNVTGRTVSKKVAGQHYIAMTEIEEEEYICGLYEILKEDDERHSEESNTYTIGTLDIAICSTEKLNDAEEPYSIEITNKGTLDRYIVAKVQLSDKLEEIPSEYWTKTDESNGYAVYVYNYPLAACNEVMPLQFRTISDVEQTNAWLADESEINPICKVYAMSIKNTDSRNIYFWDLDEDGSQYYNLKENFNPKEYYNQYFKENIEILD